ncbi:MAG: DUF5107 domain-containing protein [Sedimentisphaerales bacterium]|nr:DUF5107 domain-containing protein [Sedimentisphaerales bacterium]
MNLLQKKMMLVLFLAITLTGYLAAFAQEKPTAARTWQGQITIPTYPWQTDVNPKFWALEGAVKGSTTVKGSIVYPYTMQDHLSRKLENRTYQAIFLENEFLKITCLPELGGRLHSVLDKTQNHEVFHLNQVIKPSMIAMRGAFISGGVEWNAGPQVHTVTILSPVNVINGQNRDGSVYLEVSNLEQSLRTQWTVRLTLHPGRSYLDERIKIFNPADAMNPYYFWNCTAEPQRNGTRFIYPMTLGTDHNGIKFFSWPVNEGNDISWLKNYADASSIFGYKCEFDFFGSYQVDVDHGTVQVSNHQDLPGKKAWTWGQGEYGRVSQQNLTDKDGPYIEVQSGPLPTQSDYGMLWPREQVSWQEWWYPVHGLGQGFEFATKDLAIQPIRSDNTLEIRMMPTGIFDNATCLIKHNDRELYNNTINLSPKSPQIIKLDHPADEPVEITVKTDQGFVLAKYISPLPIPPIEPPDPKTFEEKSDDQLTTEEKYLKGLKLDRATNRPQARKYYEMALLEDPAYRPALRNLAVLDFEAGLYQSAIDILQKALQRKPDEDGLCWYFLGSSYFRLGQFDNALRCAARAAKCFGTESIGQDLLGRTYLRLNQYNHAMESFTKAVFAKPSDTKTKNHLLIAAYARGQKELAFSRARQMISQNPTNLIPRALLALQNDQALNDFTQQSHAFLGEDNFEMIEAALDFAELGLTNEALQLLAAFCVDNTPDNQLSPLPLYYLAYFAHLSGHEQLAKNYLDRAAKINKDFVFPSRPQAVEVFNFALQNNPSDAYAHLHLGNLLGNLGRLDEAVSQWKKAADLDQSLSIAFRNLGLFYWKQNDLDKASNFYRQAITARKSDQTLYRDLAEILIENHQRPQAIDLIKNMPFETLRRADIIIMWGQAYLDEKRYDECLDLLESTPYFVNWEGSSVTWNIFNQAHVARGQIHLDNQNFTAALKDFTAAITYPENIGVGKPNHPEQAQEYYLIGQTYAALNQPDQAKSAWQSGAQAQPGSEKQNKFRNLCKKALTP